MWKTVNKVLNRNTAATTISSLNVSGKIRTWDRCITEAANHHFTTAGPKLAAQIKSSTSDDPLKHIKNELSARITFQPVSNSRALQYLRNLKPGKASGPRNIHTNLFKDAAEYIEPSQKYADVVRGNLSKTKLHTLQRFQDRSLSIIKKCKN